MSRAFALIPLLALAGPAIAEKPPVAPAADSAASTAAEVEAAVEKMQAFYEKTESFDTRFEQRFQHGGMPSRLGGAAAQGRMRFQKPEGNEGPRMRWDYDDGRILLLAGDRSFTYDPDTKQVTEYRLDAANLSAAVTFLWGKGKLKEEFDISKTERQDAAGLTLELRPKKASGFQKVVLVMDPETGMVKRSIVVQGNGSENAITFRDAKLGARSPGADYDPAKIFPADAVRVRSQH